MIFPSTLFLFLFLPTLLLVHGLAPRSLRNLVLLLASLVFYSWGEGSYVFLLVGCVAGNFLFGLMLDRWREGPGRRRVLGLAIASNLGFLGWFKYAPFLVEVYRPVLAALGLSVPTLAPRALPLGISFFTFQAMSYVLDVARGRCQVQRSFPRLLLYISLFPQLVAGPIVRYQEIDSQLEERELRLGTLADGVRWFLVGLGKKVLIADQVGRVADVAFASYQVSLSPGLAWVGLLCYSLQIYHDFSGYSDMAIGLGKLFGFRFPENFRYPYAATSLRDFWRRWHISLSVWFRDYLYIPLGGNRGSSGQTARNLCLTFFLCGLWHGAAWKFVVWGCFHGVFLSLERLECFGNLWGRSPGWLQRIYTLSVVSVGWVFFRAGDLGQATGYLLSLVGVGNPHAGLFSGLGCLDLTILLATVAGAVGSIPVVSWLGGSSGEPDRSGWLALTGDVWLLLVFLLSLLHVAGTTHRSFLYFHF